MMRRLLTLALLAQCAVLAPAFADPVEDAIKARRGYFTLLGANIGPLAAMAKGEIEYDAEAAATHAGNLEALGGYMVAPHFPEGSSNADKPGDTRAQPAIWSDFSGFAAKFGDYKAAVAGLPAKVSGGRAELGAALGAVGGTCKACHDDYRAKDF